jgi:hypothetical protein
LEESTASIFKVENKTEKAEANAKAKNQKRKRENLN